MPVSDVLTAVITAVIITRTYKQPKNELCLISDKMQARNPYLTVVASGAIADLLLSYTDFFYIISAINRSAHKFVAEQVGVASLSQPS